MNRRDILKLFGAGAIIAPVAASEPVQALVLEPPKVELIEPKVIPAAPGTVPWLGSETVGIDVYLRKANGTVYSMKCEGVVADCQYETVDATALGDRFRRYINTGRLDMTVKITGAHTFQKLS